MTAFEQELDVAPLPSADAGLIDVLFVNIGTVADAALSSTAPMMRARCRPFILSPTSLTVRPLTC